jgi:hypothetical protein
VDDPKSGEGEFSILLMTYGEVFRKYYSSISKDKADGFIDE